MGGPYLLSTALQGTNQLSALYLRVYKLGAPPFLSRLLLHINHTIQLRSVKLFHRKFVFYLICLPYFIPLDLTVRNKLRVLLYLLLEKHIVFI